MTLEPAAPNQEEMEYSIFQFMHRDPIELSDSEIDALTEFLRKQRVEYREQEKAAKPRGASKATKTIKNVSPAVIDNLLADLT